MSKEGFYRCYPARIGFGAAGHAPFGFHPAEELLQIPGGNSAHGAPTSEVMQQQPQVGGKGVDGIVGVPAFPQRLFPDGDRRAERILPAQIADIFPGRTFRGWRHGCRETSESFPEGETKFTVGWYPMYAGRVAESSGEGSVPIALG